MSYRMIGAAFVAISAWLYSARFITAAIFGSGMSSWNAELFNALLEYVGSELTTAAYISLAGGLIYLVYGEIKGG